MSTGMTTKALLGGARERIHLDVQPMGQHKIEIIEKWLQAKGTHGTTQNPLTFRIGDTGLLLSFCFALDSKRRIGTSDRQFVTRKHAIFLPSFSGIGFPFGWLSYVCLPVLPGQQQTQASHQYNNTILQWHKHHYKSVVTVWFQLISKKYSSIWSSPQTLPTKTRKTTNWKWSK